MSTSTVSASVESTTKAIANARIREAGATPNSVIRDLWAHIASTGDIPVYDDSSSRRSRKQTAMQRLEALRATVPSGTPLATMSDSEVREELRNRHV